MLNFYYLILFFINFKASCCILLFIQNQSKRIVCCTKVNGYWPYKIGRNKEANLARSLKRESLLVQPVLKRKCLLFGNFDKCFQYPWFQDSPIFFRSVRYRYICILVSIYNTWYKIKNRTQHLDCQYFWEKLIFNLARFLH